LAVENVCTERDSSESDEGDEESWSWRKIDEISRHIAASAGNGSGCGGQLIGHADVCVEGAREVIFMPFEAVRANRAGSGTGTFG
jgi:hypothetical protein